MDDISKYGEILQIERIQVYFPVKLILFPLFPSGRGFA